MRGHVFRANLGESLWPPNYDSPIWTLPRKGDAKRAPLRVGFNERPSQNATHASPHRALFFVHVCCWKAVRRLGQQRQRHHDTAAVLSFNRLYRLGQQTRSLLPRTCVVDEYAAALSGLSFLPASGDASRASSLGVLLSQAASTLPAELQGQIAFRLQGGLVSSLLRAHETASLLLDLLPVLERPITMMRIQEEPLLNTRPEATRRREGCRGHIVASRIRIFGHTYLYRAVFVGQAKSRRRKRGKINNRRPSDSDEGGGQTWDIRIAVRDDVAIAGAKIWIGPLGVQALTLVYEDESTSPCLGDYGRPSRGRCVQTLFFDSTASALLACWDVRFSVCILSAFCLHSVCILPAFYC